MFSLIITIISIALVVALVAATMYYGGTALGQGTTTADQAAFVSGAQQITGAAALYKAIEVSTPTGVAGAPASLTLVGKNYLTAAPIVKSKLPADAWTITANKVTQTVKDAAVCTGLAAAGGTQYTCADVTGTLTFSFNY